MLLSWLVERWSGRAAISAVGGHSQTGHGRKKRTHFCTIIVSFIKRKSFRAVIFLRRLALPLNPCLEPRTDLKSFYSM